MATTNHTNCTPNEYGFGLVNPKNASYGPLVRIPRLSGGVQDVTVKEAKRLAREYRKAARRIEKCLG